MGYGVWATDIPEYQQIPALRALYENNGIPFAGVNLKEHHLPYEDESFDAVILCEVMEHLIFNPLPILQEINRVTKSGGFIYIGMPNQSHVIKRLQMLRGRSIHNPIDHFFKQLDPNDNVIVGLHWREYTLAETMELIEAMGYQTTRRYYFKTVNRDTEPHLLKRMVKKVLDTIPSFRQFFVVIGRKITVPNHRFWLTDANS